MTHILDKISRSICVFCGSSPGHDNRHLALAKSLGTLIGQSGDRLIYGGGGLGLMGATAQAAHENGAEVIGIIPKFLQPVEATFDHAKIEITSNMTERKNRMHALSDAFIVLPGGLGTLEEAIEILSWQRLNLHQKPIIFLSNNNYWSGILDFLRHTIDAGFAPQSLNNILLHANTVDKAYKLMIDMINNPVERESLRYANHD